MPAVVVLTAVLVAFAVLAAFAMLAAFAVLVLRAELAGIVARLHGLAGVLGRERPEVLIRAPGVAAGLPRRPLRPAVPPGGVLGYARRLGHAIVRQAQGIAPLAGIPGPA